MPHNILTVFPSAKDEVADLLIRSLVKIFGGEISIHPTHHREGAWSYLIGPHSTYHLIISDLNIPADGNSILNQEERLGLVFFERLERDNRFKAIPKILVVPRKEVSQFEVVQRFQSTKIVSYENAENFLPEFEYWAQLALEKKGQKEDGPGAGRSFGKVIIEIDPEFEVGPYALGGFEIRCKDRAFNGKEKLYFNRANITKLIKRSEELKEEDDYPKWEDKLKEIGDSLNNELCSNENKKFVRLFNKLKGRVMGDPNIDMEHISMMFIIKRQCHSILFEAFHEEEEPLFWMLRAPIYRACYVDSDFKCANPLFEGDDRSPLNCLIIQANAEGFVDNMKVNGRNLILDPLSHLESECNWLENDLFLELKKQGIVNDIMKIDEKSGDIYRAVIAELEKGKWHLVHYAGHSASGVYEGIEGSYLFFPNPDGVTVKSIGDLCMHLRKATGLVYLSSCNSADSGFVFKMAEHKVPAIVGFRWNISDDLACAFTKIFYTHLFEKRSLEKAFLKTRLKMYYEEEKNKMWAAPILIMQTTQS